MFAAGHPPSIRVSPTAEGGLRPWWVDLLVALLLACLGQPIQAFPGEPLLQRFTPADFKSVPNLLGLARDGDGRVYLGNTNGVLRMQGRDWDTVLLPGGVPAGALARGQDGRVYLSGYDTMGYILTAADGSAQYHDLRDDFGLRGADRALGWMRQVIPTADGVYFRAPTQMYFVSYSGRGERWKTSGGDSGYSAWQDALYTLDKERGLLRFDKGALVPVTGGEVMRGHAGIDIVDQGDHALVVSVGGFYRLDGRGVVALDVPPPPAEAGVFQAAAALRDGDFVLSTATGNLLEYDAAAHLLSQHRIARSAILAMTADADNGLWAISEDELVRLQIPSPWSRIDVADLGGIVNDCTMHRGALWLAVGVKGLARMTATVQGVKTDWIAGEDQTQIFAVLDTTDGLLVARDGGIDVVAADDHVQHLFARDEPVFGLVRSHYDRDLVYAPGDAGVYVLRRIDHRWTLAGLMPAPELATQSLIETAPGELWVNNTRGMPERWRIDPAKASRASRERFPLAAGAAAPDANRSTQIYALGKDVFLVIGKRAYRFDGHSFVPFDGKPFSLLDDPNEFQVLTTPVGVFAFTGHRLYRQVRGQDWRREDFGAQPVASQSVLRYGNDGVLRLSIWRALLQYRPDAAAPPAQLPLAVRLISIHRIDANGAVDALQVGASGGLALRQSESLSLRFTVFSPEPGVEYRYRIRGQATGWSDWREQTAITLTNLEQPGDYTLEIQGRTPSGRAVEPASYTFSVVPRWYQITVVRLLLALAALIVLWVVIRWREARQARVYLQRQQFLEERIAERTVALEEANRKLAELATEDSLTGVANRRALETGLEREWKRCQDRQVPIALLMIDVDHFKRYNDLHGHQAGDEVLQTVARRLGAGLDPQRELLARYGGEEFCLLLPGAGAMVAAQRAEKLRQSFTDEGAQVTVSIGVAARVPKDGDSPAALMRSADEKLYEAKRRGRNRVEVGDG